MSIGTITEHAWLFLGEGIKKSQLPPKMGNNFNIYICEAFWAPRPKPSTLAIRNTLIGTNEMLISSYNWLLQAAEA